MPGKINKIIAIVLCLCLLFEQTGFAQTLGTELNLSGFFSGLSPQSAPNKFRPLHLRYLSYDRQTNAFKLLLDKGDFKKSHESEVISLKSEKFEAETKKLFNYFLIGLALPNETFWVNLRPDSPQNIIDKDLEKTDIGRILLEADVQLKKDTANFTSPATAEGRKYWDSLYKKAEELFGYENITIPTLTRPWIVPGEIIIRESQDNAYIYKATLKVMLEQDYLKGSAAYNFNDPRLKELNEYASELIRKLIIPKLTQEVNTSKRYAPLRQVYYSLILSQWFKQRFNSAGGKYASLINKKDLSGLTSSAAWDKQSYFNQYRDSFNKGEYNLQEPRSTPLGQVIRTYMSGGVTFSTEVIAAAIKEPIFTNRNSSPMVDVSFNQGVTIGQDGSIRLAEESSLITDAGDFARSIASNSPIKQGTDASSHDNRINVLVDTLYKQQYDQMWDMTVEELKKIEHPMAQLYVNLYKGNVEWIVNEVIKNSKDEYIPVLENAIKAQYEVRQSAVKALNQISKTNKETGGYLETLLRGNDWSAAFVAAQALEGLGERSTLADFQERTTRFIMDGEGEFNGFKSSGLKNTFTRFDDQDRSLSSKMPLLMEILSSPKRTERFLFILSLMRNLYYFRITNNTLLCPIEFAKENNAQLKLTGKERGQDLYIVPGSESFRRHIIYSEGQDGEFAVELKMPGAMDHKKVVRQTDIPHQLYNINGQEPSVVRVLADLSFKGRAFLYNKPFDFSAPGEDLNLILFEYQEGKRYKNVPEAFLEKISKANYIGIRELKKRLTIDALVFAIKLHLLGYLEGSEEPGGGDMHPENLRILKNGRIVSVADVWGDENNRYEDVEFPGEKTTYKKTPSETSRKEIIDLLFRGMPASEEQAKRMGEPYKELLYSEGFDNEITREVISRLTEGVSLPKERAYLAMRVISELNQVQERAALMNILEDLKSTGRADAMAINKLAAADKEIVDLVVSSPVSAPLTAIEQMIAEVNDINIQSGVVTAHQRQWDVAIDNKSELARYLRVGKIVIADEQLILPEAITAGLKGYDIIRVKGHYRGKGIEYDRFIIPIIGAMMSDGVNNAIIEDDGIGEGVLSRVALKQGARRIVGIDTDTAALKNAKMALEKAGYKGVYLNARDWQSYIPNEDNQFILINDSLLNWFSLNPQGRSKIAGGAIDMRISNTGPFYADLYGHILKDIIIGNPQTKSILGAYVNGAGNGGNIFAATVDSLKGSGRELEFSAYSDEKAKVWTSITVMPGPSFRPEQLRKELEAVGSPAAEKQTKELAGIDFRALPIATQPVLGTVLKPVIQRQFVSGTVPLGERERTLAGTVPEVNLEKELLQIKKMINSGIIPSSERLKEYVQACCGNKEADKDIDKVLSCIAEILRLEEDRVQPTDPQLRELIVLLESGKPAAEMQLALTSISFSPKEPVLPVE